MKGGREREREKVETNLSDIKGATAFASISWFTCCKPSSSVTVNVQSLACKTKFKLTP